MLFLDNKQIEASQILSLFDKSDTFSKIKKNPSFEISSHLKKVDSANGGRIKTSKGRIIPAQFICTHPQTKLKVVLRYAESHIPKGLNGNDVDLYKPEFIRQDGSAFEFKNNIDKAVFFYLHPNNALSPIRNHSSSTKPIYEYVDTKKRSELKSDNINLVKDALDHASNIPYDKIIYFAKGLGILSVDRKEIDEVKVDIQDFALRNPKFYMEKAKTEMTFIEGKIFNLIDKQIVRLVTIGAIRRWEWAKGDLTGEIILDIRNQQQDAKKSLINFFFSDITRWMGVITDVTNTITAREKAQKDIDLMQFQENNGLSLQKHGKNLPEHLRNEQYKEFEEEEIIGELHDFIKDNGDAYNFLNKYRETNGDSGKKSTYAHASKFMIAIDAKEVTKQNYKQWIKDKFNY